MHRFFILAVCVVAVGSTSLPSSLFNFDYYSVGTTAYRQFIHKDECGCAPFAISNTSLLTKCGNEGNIRLSCSLDLVFETRCTLTCPYSRNALYVTADNYAVRRVDYLRCNDELGLYEDQDGTHYTTINQLACSQFRDATGCAYTGSNNCPTGWTCDSSQLYKEVNDHGVETLACKKGLLKVLPQDKGYFYNATVSPSFGTDRLYCQGLPHVYTSYSVDGEKSGIPLNTTDRVTCAMQTKLWQCPTPTYISSASGQIVNNTAMFTTLNTMWSRSEITCDYGYAVMFTSVSAPTVAAGFVSKSLVCSENGLWMAGVAFAPTDMKVFCGESDRFLTTTTAEPKIEYTFNTYHLADRSTCHGYFFDFVNEAPVQHFCASTELFFSCPKGSVLRFAEDSEYRAFDEFRIVANSSAGMEWKLQGASDFVSVDADISYIPTFYCSHGKQRVERMAPFVCGGVQRRPFFHYDTISFFSRKCWGRQSILACKAGYSLHIGGNSTFTNAALMDDGTWYATSCESGEAEFYATLDVSCKLNV